MAVGLLTAALAIAAHGVSGGGLATGGAAALLGVLAAAVGAVAGTWVRAPGIGVLLGLLGAGQVGAHLVLGLSGHMTGMACTSSGAPSLLMVTAHIVAVALCAVLVANGEGLCAALSSVVRPSASCAQGLAQWWAPTVTAPADQPLQSTLVVAVSISHRGPPVAVPA